MIRTPEQYVESLRDGRRIYLNGEKIEDITKHPQFQGPINGRALSYALYNHPKFKDLLTIEENGDRYLFYGKQPKSAEEAGQKKKSLHHLHALGCRHERYGTGRPGRFGEL